MWIPAAIAAGGSLISGIGSAITSRKNTRDTIRANRAMAEYQWEKNLEMWHRQNEYNAPAQQMNRFREAGLNPNLIYGQGNPGNAGTLPQYSAPRIDYKRTFPQNIGGIIQQFQDVNMRAAAIDNVRAQEELTRSKATTEAVKQQIMGIDEKSKGLNLRILQYLEQTQKEMGTEKLRALQQSITESEARTALSDLKAAYQEELNRMLIEKGITPRDSLQVRMLDLLMRKVFNVNPHEIFGETWRQLQRKLGF